MALSVVVEGEQVATGAGTIPAGGTGAIPVQLPESVQAELAREGEIIITVQSVIETDGDRSVGENRYRITAPAARKVLNWRVVPGAGGSARFAASCVGELSSRCDGTLTLYDAQTFDSAPTRAAAGPTVVGKVRLAGPAGHLIAATAKLNVEGKKRLRQRGYLKIKPLVAFTGATASQQPSEYRIDAMTTGRWIRAAIAAVRSGGDVRKDVNLLLDRARSGSVSFGSAARTMTTSIIPRRQRTLRAVRILPTEPRTVRGARSLAMCAMYRSLVADKEYRLYFMTGSYRHYVKGSVHSYRATACKDRFLSKIRYAGAKRGMRIPYPNGLWP